MPIDFDGVEAILNKVTLKPSVPARGNLGPLLDGPPIEDHDRHDETAILRAPPARRPITAALLLECSVAEKRDQALGEAQIAALDHTASRVSRDIAAIGAEGRPSGATA
jgi:hypothetical protein